jgi:hypothetical protein
MSHPDQLREYARDCLRLSQEMTSPDLKIHLINMAEAWAALAVQSERIASLCASVTAEGVASPPLAMDGAPRTVSFGSLSLSRDPAPGSMAERQDQQPSAAGTNGPDRPVAESDRDGIEK